MVFDSCQLSIIQLISLIFKYLCIGFSMTIMVYENDCK
jgi:hypothetical protein